MHMHMVIQLLVPGMEDLDNAGDSTEVSGVGRKLQEGLGTACMQEAVEELLVAVQKRVQVMGEGKDHMEIRGIDHLRTALIHPDQRVDCLAVGANAVPAGIVVGFGMPALCADTDVAPTFFGFAADDGECGILLYIGQTVGIHEGIKGSVENILYSEIRHGRHLPAGQRGL